MSACAKAQGAGGVGLAQGGGRSGRGEHLARRLRADGRGVRHAAADPLARPCFARDGDRRIPQRCVRIDGRRFDRIVFTIPVRYRHIPKDYGAFSPFSEGSTLVSSGQFHACTAAPWDEPPPLPIAVAAKGQAVGVEGRRHAARARFLSRGEGANVFLGTLAAAALARD